MDKDSKQKGGSANTILVVLLVIAAFLIGSLWTRVQTLDKNTGGNQDAQPTTAAANNPPPAQPTSDLSKIPGVSAKDHVRGDKNAQIVLIEYSDYECPYCKKFHEVMLQVIDEYEGKVKWVYRHYPLPFHQNAQMESEAAECVAEDAGAEAFWKYSDTLYEKTNSTGTSFTKEQLISMASDLNADIESCLNSGKMKKLVEDQMATGQSGGIQGTPGTVIINLKNGKRDMIGGALPFEQVKQQLDEIMK